MTTDYREHLRREERDQAGRLRHDARRPPRRSTSSRGLGPEDVDVVELHDCFAANELITYEALGLCPEGKARRVHRLRRPDLRRPGRGEPVGRPDLQGPPARRHRASRSAPSSTGSCAARPTSARSRAPRSPSSTTSASAAPPW